MEESFKIRPARTDDKDKILSLIGSHPSKWDKRIAKRYYDHYFSDESSKCFSGDKVYVLTLRGEIIGVTGYSLDQYETNNYWLGWFYIHKDYQNRDLGKELLEYVASRLRRKRVKKLFVDTSSDEFYERALTIYLKNGFRIEAVIKGYYGKGEDQIILSKTLK